MPIELEQANNRRQVRDTICRILADYETAKLPFWVSNRDTLVDPIKAYHLDPAFNRCVEQLANLMFQPPQPPKDAHENR